LNEETLRFAFLEEISLQNVQRLEQLERLVMEHWRERVVECVSGYYTLTVFLRKAVRRVDVEDLLEAWCAQSVEALQLNKRQLRIPVCYDEEFALDMERMRQETGLSAGEIVRLHCEPVYTVYLTGFLPGFPYSGGLDERLVVPRLNVPRVQVAAGSVGIGGAQTGIYPIDSPGGWNVIGRTPLKLFDVEQAEPFLFAPNDEVRFVTIDKGAFTALQKDGVSGWNLY